MNRLFKESPKQILDEFDTLEKTKAQNYAIEFYKNKYTKNMLIRICFDFVCGFDKTLLTLVVGSLTGFTINIASNIVNLDWPLSDNSGRTLLILQFILSLLFNVFAIEFTTVVIKIQESGTLYFPNNVINNENGRGYLTSSHISKAKNNITFFICAKNWGSIKFWLIGSIVTVVALFVTIFKALWCETIINNWIAFYTTLSYWLKLGIKLCVTIILGGLLYGAFKYGRNK